MKPVTIPRVKVCCITSITEAEIAIRCGASALGLVSAMPSGPGVIDEALITEIVMITPPAVATFLLTSNQNSDSIIDQVRRCRTNTVQIVDRVDIGVYSRLRSALPNIKIVQVIHVSNEDSVIETVKVAPLVDAVLLDSGNQSLFVKELGGTGRIHDWTISRQIRQRISKPLFLAGGLKLENVRQAIQQVQPYAIDVCSGVRTDGRLDEKKLRQFINMVNMASAAAINL